MEQSAAQILHEIASLVKAGRTYRVEQLLKYCLKRAMLGNYRAGVAGVLDDMEVAYLKSIGLEVLQFENADGKFDSDTISWENAKDKEVVR